MKTILFKLRASYLAFAAGLVLLASCNKDLEQFAPIATPVYPTGNGIAATLAANPNYSNYAALIARAGMTATLNDLTKSYTIFATDNFGMNVFANAASGGLVPIPAPNSVVLGFINTNLPVASAAGIVMYNTIGQKFPFSTFTTTFPNYPITSLIVLDPNQPFVRMPLFPLRGTPYSYINNVPITGIDMAAANGIIHTAYSIAAPPTATLKTMIAAEPTLSYFRAAVARADSGSVGLSRFDSLMNYGVTNMTVLAPNDVAFQTLVFGLVYSQVFAATGNAALALASANGAVAAGPAFLSTNNVSTALVRGIVAYHLMASLTTSTTTPYQPNIRVFSNNVPAGAPTFIKTLVNGSIAAHPGVSAQATYTGPAVTALAFRGYGTFPPGGTPYTGTPANAITRDKHAVNGVYHILDNVLLPQ